MGFLSYLGHRLLGFGLGFLTIVFFIMASFGEGTIYWALTLISGIATAYFFNTQH